jgi:hypothetical protein
LTLRRQKLYIVFRKKHKTALVSAAGGAAGTGKPEPIRVKRLSAHHTKVILAAKIRIYK